MTWQTGFAFSCLWCWYIPWIASAQAQGNEAQGNQESIFDHGKARAEVVTALSALSDKIKSATVSRATVELTSRGLVGSQEVTNQNAVYQIASRAPQSFTAYYKSPEQPFRIFCNTDAAAVLVSPTAYFKMPVPESLQAVVMNLPVPLGPYPEPVLALTLCGVDIRQSLLTDMETVEIVDRDPFNEMPAVHIRGRQVDGVVWDLWIASEKDKEQPLRMVVDLTAVVGRGEGESQVEEFSYELEFKFVQWRMSGEVDPSLFVLKPPSNSVEYKSLDDYYQSIANETAAHRLIGQPAPDGEAALFDHGVEAVAERSRDDARKVKISNLKGKIVVFDFWATWCGPCIEAMPVVTAVTKKFADRGVVFYAINAGDQESEVKKFFADREVRPDVLLDLDGKISDAYKAEAIPQTVIIGKDGTIQAVHVGYASLDAFEKELSDQLEALANGGTLIEAK